MSSRFIFEWYNSETDLNAQTGAYNMAYNQWIEHYDFQIRTREKISEFSLTLPWNKQQIRK